MVIVFLTPFEFIKNEMKNLAEKMLSASKNRELLILQYARCRSASSIPTNKQDVDRSKV